MSDAVTGSRTPRVRLSLDRVLRGAVELADTSGVAGLTIRSLADALGVKPMSLYYYVANKEAILDGIVDIVFSEMDLPVVGGEWRTEISTRARSARQVLTRHPWAIQLLESRTSPGPATLRHHDAVLGTFLAAGFSPEATAHAYAVLDAFIYGFAVQESSLPFEGPDGVTEVAEPIMELMSAGEFPHMAAMAMNHYLKPGYDFAHEFEFGLNMILDGLSALLPQD